MKRTHYTAISLLVTGLTLSVATPFIADAVTRPTTKLSAEHRAPMSPGSQQNAVRMAQKYIAMSPFSRKGLIEQLQYEGFSLEDATYGVDNITVDWNAQAAKHAQKYLNMSAFSRQGLMEQLIYEGYTPAQAQYGVASTGI
ncbi:prophage Lp1 protein 5 [Mycobacteroides abscessus subsp. massiliense]|uniref:Prophage Lp1 protein 5 n=2 Tax=Mycobacteroides abscessus TaxID=36809 RepID=A0A1T5TJX6_9MYCO|nr:Ltp family lipoprotein [Mycobacteroides abscessus]SIN12777.1 prophage Lp1 protein 5 [Mycobacteroides abscessus subsp. bolletii]MBE5403396.1 hypothetical protein [Mycobacteroides abscessus]MBE5431919.1 hypothetical protein [Mycobacteroides abscessus]MBE5443281.1 hypothetical protein [Mycobacteroides abscessus]MBE5500986.1 hypothetical protein [Mycobacteroides abscessus]